MGGYTKMVERILGIRGENPKKAPGDEGIPEKKGGHAEALPGTGRTGTKVSVGSGSITLVLGVDYLDPENRGRLDENTKCVIYTGSIDEYFGYSLGALEYRRVTFETEDLPVENYQGNAVINYTDGDTPYTRIIEHKWFEFGKDDEGNDIPHTVISKEYSTEWKKGDEPYYPVNDERNTKLYEEYRRLAGEENERREASCGESAGEGEKPGKPRIIFGGRLGEYRYYDMDQVIGAALRAVEEEGAVKVV
ncbi:MAG: UDP-galactopyranose mutase [Lachnospiraceae bacterium]|nr:UDP-galactopyranose mutase [Lachnospiraceae bacterium]